MQYIIFKNGDRVNVDGGEPINLFYSHMAMIELLPDGRLIAAWQGSAQIEGGTDQRIYLTTSKDKEGRRWEVPTSMPESLRLAGQWSPVLHMDAAQGILWVFYAESSTDCLRRTIKRPGRAVVPPRWAVGGHIKV
jgi:predicted neuraminidase